MPAGLELEVELASHRETIGLCQYFKHIEDGPAGPANTPLMKFRVDDDFVRKAHAFNRMVARGRHDHVRVAAFGDLFHAWGRRRLASLRSLAGRIDKQRPDSRFALAQRLDRAHRYMLSHLDRTLELDELAAVATMSKFEFCRAFHRAFGQPPLTAHRRARLQRAASLIRHSDRTATEVAEQLGFSELANFSRAFRKQFGCPPGQYRTAQSRT